MVARINTGKSIAKALNYNEQKVQEGMAEKLMAFGFIKDMEMLSFHDKMEQFQRHISLNQRASTNTLHVSLNFDANEKISSEKMKEIAEAYMEKIGFGNQPYLVYRHNDSGHPHLHIVSTNIEKDGKRISMHNLGRIQSEKARKEIELSFGLVKASENKKAESLKITPVNAQKLSYGKAALKRSISSVLASVIDSYKYSSLAELNAVLRLYNVNAERGSEGSRMNQHKGLAYHAIDDNGKKIGVPIKASAFYMKPTLAKLEKKFTENERLKEVHSKRLKVAIGWVLNKQPTTIESFIKTLEKESISTVLRKGKEDMVYGITYVDHKTKCVFNGSDLGKAYSAKAVMEKYTPELSHKQHVSATEKMTETTIVQQQRQDKKEHLSTTSHESRLQHLSLGAAPSSGYVPYGFKKKKKKKKRMSINH